jgi:hypothetical protein
MFYEHSLKNVRISILVSAYLDKQCVVVYIFVLSSLL